MLHDRGAMEVTPLPFDRHSMFAPSVSDATQQIVARELQALRVERASLVDTVDALRKDVEGIPMLEQELLYHADRADAMEQTVALLQARNQQLEVLAHRRMRSQYQLSSAAQMRCLHACVGTVALANALRTWRVAVLVWASAPREAELAQLQYQNLMLQRHASEQLIRAKHEMGATVMWQAYRRLDSSRLALAFRHWIDVPRALSTYVRSAPADVPSEHALRSRGSSPRLTTRSPSSSTRMAHGLSVSTQSTLAPSLSQRR